MDLTFSLWQLVYQASNDSARKKTADYRTGLQNGEPTKWNLVSVVGFFLAHRNETFNLRLDGYRHRHLLFFSQRPPIGTGSMETPSNDARVLFHSTGWRFKMGKQANDKIVQNTIEENGTVSGCERERSGDVATSLKWQYRSSALFGELFFATR